MLRNVHRLLLVPLSIGIVVFLQVGAYAGGDDVKSNMELADELTTGVVKALLASVPQSISARDITLSPYARDEPHEFIANVFTRILTASGYTTYAPNRQLSSNPAIQQPVEKPEKGLVLEFQAVEFSLTYPKSYRAYLIGGKKVKRKNAARKKAARKSRARK